MLYHAANEPDILQEAIKRQNRILDADYPKVEVDPFVQELKHLTMDETQILSKTLKKFQTLFGGGLGMLNIKPVRLELIYGAKPYHARPFPVPQSLEATTKLKYKDKQTLTYSIEVRILSGQHPHLFKPKRQAMCVY
jgi:hypothetical protein